MAGNPDQTAEATITWKENLTGYDSGTLADPTLSFQLSQGFEVLAVVSGYLLHDPESLGYAAVIEWLNPNVATPTDLSGRDPRFLRPGATAPHTTWPPPFPTN